MWKFFKVFKVMKRIFINCNDSATPQLPLLKQKKVKFMSFYYVNRLKKILKMELVTTKDGWKPTWVLANEDIKKYELNTVIERWFEITVLEGTVLKRVVKRGNKTTTRLFVVTRKGLIELLYDYTGGYYVTNTGLWIRDRRKR